MNILRKELEYLETKYREQKEREKINKGINEKKNI